MNSGNKLQRVLVTDAHELAGLATVRSLGRAGYRVIAGYAGDHGRPAVASSRYCRETVEHPNAWTNPALFRSWLQDFQSKCDIILPISEAALVGVARLRSEFGGRKLLILPDDASLQVTLSKYRANRKAMELGIACPRTVFIRGNDGEQQWNDDLSALRFPIVIKTDNHFTEDGQYKKGRATIATNADEANEVVARLRPSREAVLAQEWVPGYGAGAFLLRSGERIQLVFSHKRLHEVPYSGGYSSLRQSTYDRECLDLGAKLLESIGYNGAAMVEFRRNPAHGATYFLEVNGRLWGSLALALHAGVDFPLALLESSLSDLSSHQRPASYKIGLKCRNIFPGELGHLHSVFVPGNSAKVAPPPSKTKALLTFFGLSLNPGIRHDYFWWTDPLPGFVQSWRTLRHSFWSLLRYGRRAAASQKCTEDLSSLVHSR